MIKFDERRPFQPSRKLHFIAEYYAKDHLNMKYEEIKEAMLTLYNPVNENYINLGNIGVVRARKIKRTFADFDLKNVLNPSPEYVVNYGRCNKPNESVFYGAFDVVTALKELNAKKGDKFIIGVFTLRPRGMSIGSSIVGIPINIPGEQNEDFQVTCKIVSNFFFNEFVREVPEGEEYRYRQSCALSENIFERKNRDSIIYPSVKDYSRWNIAIRSSDVKERLTINGTTEIEIIDVHPNHYRVKQLIVYYFEDKQLKTRTPMNEIDYYYGTYFEKDPNIILNDFLKDHIYLRKRAND